MHLGQRLGGQDVMGHVAVEAEADEIARAEEFGDLAPAVGQRQRQAELSGGDGIDMLGRVALLEQQAMRFQYHGVVDVFQAVPVVTLKAGADAELAHRAGGAGIADRTAHRTMHRAGGPCGAVTGRGFEGHNGHGELQQSSVVGAIIACGRTRACARRVAASLCRSFPGNIEPIPYRLDTIRLSQILRPAFCQYGSRSLRLKILPESSRGSVAATSTRRGSLYLAMRGSRKACTSAGVGQAAAAPGSIQAQRHPPNSSSSEEPRVRKRLVRTCKY